MALRRTEPQPYITEYTLINEEKWGDMRLLGERALTQDGRDHLNGDFIDSRTSMLKDSEPLQGLLFSQDLGFSHILHVLKGGRRRRIV